ncbi:hypothetical protein D7W79_21960 [Corallococcus exercitus]|nr:hypothetical protein D7W79_21960 [Corallococcus exercitus]
MRPTVPVEQGRPPMPPRIDLSGSSHPVTTDERRRPAKPSRAKTARPPKSSRQQAPRPEGASSPAPRGSRPKRGGPKKR